MSALHRFATLVAASAFLLILAGSLVTSHDAGLSVPDWPTSYGWNMLTFPRAMWVANIFYEHVHRLIASTVGLLTIIMAAWLWIAEPRRWLRWLGLGALGVVIAQGLLGGLTVLYFLPPAVSTAHAGLAEVFFCMTVAIALFTSPRWKAPCATRAADARLRRVTSATTIAIYCQILIGATMRHTGTGLAIPDFPLMFGGLWPDHWTAGIGIHFAHRVGACVVAATSLGTSVYIWRRYTDHSELTSPTLLVLVSLAVQIALGAMTVMSGRQPMINSLHVVGGALALATSLIITLRSWRTRIAGSRFRVE